jgi:hypothetical protein
MDRGRIDQEESVVKNPKFAVLHARYRTSVLGYAYPNVRLDEKAWKRDVLGDPF